MTGKIQLYMKRILYVLIVLTLGPNAFSQLIPDDDLRLVQDSLIYPVYDYEYIPDVPYDSIQQRIAALEKTVPLHFNNRVKAFVDYFTITDRDYTRDVLGKANIYFPVIEKILAENGLPDELKYLSIVESGLNPKAKSRVSAVGLWQFMYSTARVYNLKIDWYVDERMDPAKSTEAACKYLKSLYDQFDDWELAMAAYNCGPGNVRKAIRRSGYKHKFWEIYRYLPRETRSYVPQFVAINYVANNMEAHNIYTDGYEQYMPQTDTIIVYQPLYLKTLADLTGICTSDLELMNPTIKRRIIPESEKDFALHIPVDVKSFINTNRESILDSARYADKTEMDFIARNEVGSTYGRERMIHIVRSGDALSILAEHYKVRIEDLREWNNLSGNLIRVNQRLIIWVTPRFYDSSTRLAAMKQTPVSLPDAGDGNYYIVQPGDSLWKITQQYEGLTIEMLKKLNNLNTNKIIPGQRLKVG
jgi:membrane-bound lytic murein transglycosylase D